MDQFQSEEEKDKLSPEQKRAVYESVMNRYKDAAADNDDVAAAEAQARKANFLTNLTQGLTSFATAQAGRGRVDSTRMDNKDYWSGLRKQNDQLVADAKTAKEQKLKGILAEDQMQWTEQERGQKMQDWSEQDQVRERESDPNSPESKAAQSVANKMMPGQNFSGMTAKQLKSVMPSIEKMYSVEQAKLTRQDAAREKADTKKQLKDSDDMQKLSKDVAGTQDMANALDEVEGVLGFKLEDATKSGDSIKVKGKEMDLPGVSLPGVGRVSAYSDKARDLQSATAKVFNTVLKDRSGAAVTNAELERLRTEFGEGKYNSEAQMVDALQRYKRAVAQELKNREAAYRPEIVEKYTEQGGRTSKTISTSGSGKKSGGGGSGILTVDDLEDI